MVALNSLTRKVQKLENLHCMQTELHLRQELLEAIAEERTKQELAETAQLNDAELIDRLFEAGFTGKTLPALTLAPLALVAWGSGFVTQEERSATLQAALDSEVSDNPDAMAQFQSWLDKRPGQDLLSLWADFTQARMQRPESRRIDANRMMDLATQVAMASGGFLGFGAVCEGERMVIDRVYEVLKNVLR